MRKSFLIGIAALFGLVALVRHLPLSWAGAALPDSVGTLSGTIWDGQISDVPLLGSIAVKGGLGYALLSTPPGDVSLSGKVSPNSVEDLVLSMPVSRLPTSDTRLSGLAGRVSIRIEEATIENQACISASGTASTDILAVNQAQFGWAGPKLSGPVDCLDGRLRVQLSGATGAETVEALIVTGLDGTYRSDITVMTGDPVAGNALALFGFALDGGQYRLSEQGQWR